jgi:hypothetical protein
MPTTDTMEAINREALLIQRQAQLLGRIQAECEMGLHIDTLHKSPDAALENILEMIQRNKPVDREKS